MSVLGWLRLRRLDLKARPRWPGSRGGAQSRGRLAHAPSSCAQALGCTAQEVLRHGCAG